MCDKRKKLPTTAWLSTVIIGIYTLFLAVAEAGMAFLCLYADHITAAGAQMASGSLNTDDYISGYLMLPGSFTALLGSLTGTMALILSACILIFLLVCPIVLVVSVILLTKQKIHADAWLKVIAFFILSIISWMLFESIFLTMLMVMPAALGAMTLSNERKAE